jgi:AraC-like DNA-binding protein
MHRAAQLLAATELRFKGHRASLGFASRSHFSRAFRRATAPTPRTYRKHQDRNTIELPANSGRSLIDKLSD